jgi:hypothetical protein
MIDNEPVVWASRILYETNRQEPAPANLRGPRSHPKQTGSLGRTRTSNLVFISHVSPYLPIS